MIRKIQIEITWNFTKFNFLQPNKPIKSHPLSKISNKSLLAYYKTVSNSNPTDLWIFLSSLSLPLPISRSLSRHDDTKNSTAIRRSFFRRWQPRAAISARVARVSFPPPPPDEKRALLSLPAIHFPLSLDPSRAISRANVIECWRASGLEIRGDRR